MPLIRNAIAIINIMLKLLSQNTKIYKHPFLTNVQVMSAIVITCCTKRCSSPLNMKLNWKKYGLPYFIGLNSSRAPQKGHECLLIKLLLHWISKHVSTGSLPTFKTPQPYYGRLTTSVIPSLLLSCNTILRNGWFGKSTQLGGTISLQQNLEMSVLASFLVLFPLCLNNFSQISVCV